MKIAEGMKKMTHRLKTALSDHKRRISRAIRVEINWPFYAADNYFR